MSHIQTERHRVDISAILAATAAVDSDAAWRKAGLIRVGWYQDSDRDGASDAAATLRRMAPHSQANGPTDRCRTGPSSQPCIDTDDDLNVAHKPGIGSGRPFASFTHLVAAIERPASYRRVESGHEVHATAAHLPVMQGGGPGIGSRFAPLRLRGHGRCVASRTDGN